MIDQEFAMIDGRVVSVNPIDRRMFDSLQRDACRIMGELPAKDGGYLECADLGSSAHQFAARCSRRQVDWTQALPMRI